MPYWDWAADGAIGVAARAAHLLGLAGPGSLPDSNGGGLDNLAGWS